MKKNYCKTEGPISSCSAEDRANQKNCIFYDKATRADKCMYLRFDEYCDCLRAQMALEKSSEGVK